MRVLVSLVSHNSAADLPACLEAVARQTVPVQVAAYDNASRDDSLAILQAEGVPAQAGERNSGFCAAHNANLVGREFDYALVLNPDTVIADDYVERLVEAVGKVPGAGMAQGKLWRMARDKGPALRGGLRVIDSAGMVFTPFQRHFDRGSQQSDRGQFDQFQEVFGVTAAAALYSKRLLEAVRFQNEYFDEDFFAYREDADLCWRARRLGFSAVYEPRARGLHRRAVLPGRRRGIPQALNRHSLKNRYLMRTKNMDASVRLRCFPWMYIRDLGILGYALIRERTSLAAYRDAWRLRRRMRLKRRALEAQGQTVDVGRWFSFSDPSRNL